MFQST